MVDSPILGSNITHQAGTTDAERLATMAKRLREVEQERDEERARLVILVAHLQVFANDDHLVEVGPCGETWTECRYCGSHGGLRGHHPECPVALAQGVLTALPADLPAQRQREQVIIAAATEYRQVNQALDEEPSPHPDPLARTILIEIGEQKRAALFAAVDGLGEGAKDV